MNESSLVYTEKQPNAARRTGNIFEQAKSLAMKQAEVQNRVQADRMQRGYEALAAGWQDTNEGSDINARRRKSAVDAFGEDYVSMFEAAPVPEQKRALAERFLTDYYTKPGDESFRPALRYCEQKGVDPNADVYSDIHQRFLDAGAVRYQEEKRIENMREEEMQWIERYLAGEEEMSAEHSDAVLSLFGNEMVKRIAKVRSVAELIDEDVSQKEGSSKRIAPIHWEDPVYSAIVDPETGEIDEASRMMMSIALHGIAKRVQESDRGVWAFDAALTSLSTSYRQFLVNLLREDSADYQRLSDEVDELERLANDEAYYRSKRMTQERRTELMNAHTREAAIELRYGAPLYDPEERKNIAEKRLPEARRKLQEVTSRKIVRGMLQDYVKLADSSPEGTSWYKKALKGVGDFTGSTVPYLVPYVGPVVGTATNLVSSSDYNLNANLEAGLTPEASLNRAKQDALISSSVELLPWSRVGGLGFNATIGRGLKYAGYKPGAFSSMIAEFASRGTAHAALTETVAGVIDEGVLEPLAQGLLTMSTDAAMDALGVDHGVSRSYSEAFAELKEVWTDPTQLTALVLFSGALTGARLPQMHAQSKEFAAFMREASQQAGVWQAMGLSDGDVRRVMQSDNPLQTGSKLFNTALERDPEGLKRRMAKQGARLQEEGFSLRLTGTTGELSADTEAALAEAYREMVDERVMPQVERIADKDGQMMFRLTERDRHTNEVVSEQELSGAQADTYLQLRMAQVDARRLRLNQQTVYEDMAQHVEQLAGAALTQQAEELGAAEGLAMQNMNELPEGVGEAVQQAGFLSFRAMKLAAAKLGGQWKHMVEAFQKRAQISGRDAEMSGTAAFRAGRSAQPLSLGEKTVFGSMISYAQGNVTPLEMLEESVETRADMWLQLRAQELADVSEDADEAQRQALGELADVVRRARAELLKMEPSLKISEVPEHASYMEVIEAMSDMGRARLLTSPVMPSWMNEVQDIVSSALDETAEAIRIADTAKRASTQDMPGWKQLEDIFASFDLPMGNVYSAARIDAAVIEQVRCARARVRGTAVATTAAEVMERQAEDAARDAEIERRQEAYEESEEPQASTPEEGKPTAEQVADTFAQQPEAMAPSGMKGVFVRDACVYNEAGGFYIGCVPVRNLRDSKEIEQVKAGDKGAHGVVNPITGEYQQETEAIYVWRRRDGALEVISGRHKYALALENGTESVICYVFNEDAQHDAKWARLLDFENNMRGDQADELTSAIYTRETGYDDATLRRKGLMRNKSKSKRGIIIGREARAELWDRFVNGAVSPMDAEIICTMTQGVRDKKRVDEIQRRCCMLLDQGKSWEYISAMVQLMANKESVFMKQGLLDLGVDFEADMARAAAYVEDCVKKLSEAINVIKSGRRLSGEKRKLAERLGQFTTSTEASETLFRDLTDMRERFRNIGAYPDLVAAASMWDGKTELDPVEMARTYAHSELEQAAAEANMTREQWEEAQAAKAAQQAAQEATGSLFSSFSQHFNPRSSVSFSVADMRKTRVRLSAKDVAEMSAMPNLRMDVDNLDQVYEMAKAGMDDIRNAIESVGRDLGLIVKMRNSLKGRERANYKVRFDYEGDAGKLLDVYGGTIVLQPGDSFTDVIDAVKERGLDVVRVKSGYAHESKYGYADVKLNLRTRHGFIGELILIEQHMMEVKGEVGHLIYEVGRKIDQAIESEPDSVKKARLKTLQEALAQYSQGLYQGADYNDMKELRERALDACQEAQSTLKGYVSAELPELETVLGKLQQGEEYYSTRAQNSFSLTSKKSYGRLSYEGFSGNDQRVYFPWYMDKRYQLPQRSFPQTLSVSRSSMNRKKSILETASRNSSRVSNEVNIDNSPVSQGEEKSKNNFAKSASSAEEVEGILPLRTWEGWLQFEHGGFDPAAPDITFSMVSPREAQRIAREFNALEKSEGIRISAPGVYVKDTKAAAAYAKERYNALKAEVEGGKPLLMPIAGEQKEIQLPGRGFNEVKHHAADRRNLACLCGLRDLCESAIYINSASDSKRDESAFNAVVAYHYFAAKGNFEGASAYNADNSDVAYVSIVIAERSNGEFFYDLNATNVEAIDNDKNTSEELPSNRVTNSAMAAPGGVRKGRIHLTKEFVNYVNAKNAVSGSFSLRGTKLSARELKRIDAQYQEAVKAGDLTQAAELVAQYAAAKGYGIDDGEWKMMHRAPDRQSGESLENIAEGRAVVPADYWEHPEWYQTEDVQRAAFDKVKDFLDRAKAWKRGERKEPVMRFYRAVPKDVRESYFRNGDWITHEKEYAQEHGLRQFGDGKYRVIIEAVKASDAWWNGDDICEWGYDDGKNYAYQNTPNNRKLLDVITYDPEGNPIPLSKRFNKMHPSVSFSIRDMSQAARVMLRRREDDLEGEELIARWDELLERLETASVDSHDGAARLGVLVALLESTRSVLPPQYAKLGRLHALMKWAAVYAHMVSTGEVKRDGVLKGVIFEKFAAAMQREYEGSLQRGLSEEEAREVLQELGERKLEDALMKVAKECRARLDVFVKARARERIRLTAQRAYPKKEKGRKSPRGKMEAAHYRAMSTMLAWMDASAEKVAERMQQLRASIEQMESADDNQQDGASRAELEEELRIVQLYGDWSGMSAAQARRAAEDFVQFVLTNRHSWDARLEEERRRREWSRLRMRFSTPSNSNTRSKTKREGGLLLSAGRSLRAFVMNSMSYSQMMLAGRRVFGEAFTRARLQEIADANAALRNARRERDDVFAMSLMEATGKKRESELVKWLNRFGRVEKKTGIFKREVSRHTLEMSRDEAEAWCSMTPQQRAARRRELYAEAEASGLAPVSVPTESDVEKLAEELAAMEERNSKAQKVRVKVPRYGEKIELEASRDAVANAILLLEQEDYQHLIEYEGFTPRDKDGKEINRDLDPDTPLDVEQTLKPLYDFIGEDGRAFAYALRRYVGQNGKRMQAVYEAQQGVPLAMKPNYWRGNFNLNTIKEKDTLTENNGSAGGAGGYGFLIDRVRHYNRLEWTNTATMVFGTTVETQNNYTYTSGITREWRALLTDTDFQKRLEVELGRPYMTALKEWLDIIDGVRRSSPAVAWLGRLQQRLSRGLAFSALAGNGFVLAKQGSAILHGLLGGEVPRGVVERGDGVRELTWRKIGLVEYAAAMARTKAGLGAISLRELASCEWFKARTDSRYKNLARRMSMSEDKKQHAFSNKLADKTMDVIEWVDRGANLIGMQALADAVYRDVSRINREKELGMSESEIKREALAAVGRALSISAQPHEASEKSLFGARGGIISNMLFQFKSETINKMGLVFSRMLSGETSVGLRDYMIFGVVNASIAALIAWIRYGDDDKDKKDEDAWKSYVSFVLSALTGDLSAVPLLGDEIRRGTSMLTGEYYRQRGILEGYFDVGGMRRHVQRLATGEKSRKPMDWHDYVVEVNGLVRKLGVLSSFLGDGATWSELVLSAAAASNVVRTGADVANGLNGN